jgi:hypothetical protein
MPASATIIDVLRGTATKVGGTPLLLPAAALRDDLAAARSDRPQIVRLRLVQPVAGLVLAKGSLLSILRTAASRR